MPGALLEVRGLTIEIVRDGVRYQVIDGVDFTINRGESVAMVGESASGKSLIAMGAIDLLGAGAGVVSGTTTFDGTLLQDLDDADWRLLVGMGIGVLFQDAIGSWDPLDVMGYQSGEALLEHTDLPAEEIVKRVRDALGEVGLPKGRHFSAYVHEVSRGQAQRAMLAATLLSAPRLLIADEPLSGLDVTVARAVLDLIDDLRTKRGMGMLLVTHDLAVVAAVADRVLVVYGGAIVEDSPVGDLFRRPRHPYTAGLLGSVPDFVRERLRPIEGEPPELWNLPTGCAFAPRCPYAIDRCRAEQPKPRQVGSSVVACHRADELELAGVGS